MPDPVAQDIQPPTWSAGAGSFRAGWRAWGAVFRASARDLWANNVMEWAAALAFYAVLSLFPLALAAAATAAYVVDAAWAVDRLAALLAGFVPRGVVDAQAIVDRAIAVRGRVGLLAIGGWLFAGRRILGTLVTALDQVSDVDHERETVRRRVLVEIALLTGLVGMFTLALTAEAVVDRLWTAAGVPYGPRGATMATTVAAVRAGVLVLTFYALYALVPRGRRGRRAALTGAVVAAALFLVARALFLAALSRIWAGFDLVYGPLAVAAVLLLWAWYAALVVLFGASLASHAKVMLAEGASPTEARRRHVERNPRA